MDDLSIAGPPCPFCGANAFSGDPSPPEPDDILELGELHAQYYPRCCTECGNVQIVLTRCEFAFV